MLGARIVVQPSTLVMLAVLSFLFASAGGQTTSRTLAIGFILAASLMVSVFLHELAHAIAARALRRRVSEIVLTLWGGHTSFDSKDLTPAVNGITALAGPVMNLVIALGTRGAVMVTEDGSLTELVISYVAWANVFLAIFNLLPGIPMDGGRVLESIVWAATRNRNRAMVVAAWGGRVVAVLVCVYVVGAPLLRGDRPDVYDAIVAMVMFSILWPSASAALRFARLMQRRDTFSMSRVMQRAIAVPYQASVADALAQAHAAGVGGEASVRTVVVVGADGVPAGRFELAATDEVPANLRAATSVQALTVPLPRGAHVGAHASTDELLAQVRQWWGKTDVLIAMNDDVVVGVVPIADVAAAFS